MPTTLEAKSRITARAPAELRDTPEQAAQLQGATLNQFVVQSAYQAAQRIVERDVDPTFPAGRAEGVLPP